MSRDPALPSYFQTLSPPGLLTVELDGQRIGQVAIRRYDAHGKSVLGELILGPDWVERLPEVAEAGKMFEAWIYSDVQEKETTGPPYQTACAALARRIRLLELPVELALFAVEIECGTVPWVRLIPKQCSAKERAKAHPPRCVQSLRPTLVAEQFPGMDEVAFKHCVFFRISCPCGEEACHLLGYFAMDEGPSQIRCFVSPLGLECPACGRTSEVLDTRQHGYGGEQGCDCNQTGQGPRNRFPCPQCGETRLRTFPGFSYHGIDHEPWNVGQRTEDLFDWFWLYGQCNRCATFFNITGFECA